MFSKKPRRNFRTRRDESSEEEEQETNEAEENRVKPAPVLRRPKLPQSRGISCTSKPETTDKTRSGCAEDAGDKNLGVTAGNLLEPAEKMEQLLDDVLSSDDEKEGSIPDRKQIRAARKQRREARVQAEYIPLDSELQGSRLSEEESERDSDDDDDHEHQIQFAPKMKSLRERVAEEMGGSDSEEEGTGSQGDEDHTLWEEQQIRKGVSLHKHYSSSLSRETVRQKKCEIPESLPQISIDVIKKRVSAKLDVLRQVSRGRAMEHQKIQLEMDSSKASLEQLENGRSAEQHRFYRGMWLYTQNLLGCLGEKVVEINEVEHDLHALLIEQAEVLLLRRQEAVRKESHRLQLLSYCSDQFDRDADGAQVEVERQSPVCETAGADLPADDQPLPEEAAELCRKRDEILKKTENVFADVHDDFSDVKNILSKFEEWRALFPDSYNNAYISLCLPKLLAPFVRHQLIAWDPLKTDCKDIETFPWYSAVEKFCHWEGSKEVENPDNSVLTSIIEKTIVPKIQGFVDLVWDPLSTGQSRCLVTLCRSLLDDHLVVRGERSKPVQALLEAVTVRMRNAVDVDVFIPLYPKKFLDDTSSPQFKFQDEQFHSAVKLLHNITLWHGLLPEDVLIELGLNKLLNRYLTTLRTVPCGKRSVEKCRKVAACFPKSWSSPSIPELEIFNKHLLHTAHELCKKNPDSTISRDIVTDLLILLKNMKALDSVAEIVENYHFQGF